MRRTPLSARVAFRDGNTRRLGFRRTQKEECISCRELSRSYGLEGPVDLRCAGGIRLVCCGRLSSWVGDCDNLGKRAPIVRSGDIREAQMHTEGGRKL
ncbi:hypothetical protein CEP53_004033 [Fusarium sp. AF-6]|nr:hypothetical protein CEP53_004033 [Fusarium sp. AF-6]